MSERALDLLLAARRGDEAAAATALERAERERSEASLAASLARDGVSAARAALDEVTRGFTAASRATAGELLRLSARRATLVADLAAAEARVKERDARLAAATSALGSSKRALAEAIEHRRTVEVRAEERVVEARRARASRDDDDAAEAHAAWASRARRSR